MSEKYIRDLINSRHPEWAGKSDLELEESFNPLLLEARKKEMMLRMMAHSYDSEVREYYTQQQSTNVSQVLTEEELHRF